MPWATDGSQDTVQFQKIYERFRHPECHEYLFERDGMSNTVTSNAYWQKLLRAGVRHVDKLVLDRRPGVIRAPFDVPETTAEWLATDWSPNSTPYDLEPVPSAGRRRRAGPRVPAVLVGGTTAGVAKIGSTLRVDKGDSTETWSRFNPATDNVTLPLAA